MVIPGVAGDPNRELTCEIGSHASHAQTKGTSHRLRKGASILINGESINRQGRYVLTHVQEFSGPIHRQNLSKVEIESGERRTGSGHQGPGRGVDLKYGDLTSSSITREKKAAGRIAGD